MNNSNDKRTMEIVFSDSDDEDDYEDNDIVESTNTLAAMAQSLLNRTIHILNTIQSQPFQNNTNISTNPQRHHKRKPLEGLSKFENMVKREKEFLEKILKHPEKIATSHVQCTNVNYFEGILALLFTEKNLVAVLKQFIVPKNSPLNSKKVRVDVVSEGGMKWIKVKARSMKGLTNEMIDFLSDDSSQDSSDDTDTDENEEVSNSISKNNAAVVSSHSISPIFRMAKELLTAAQEYQVHYQTPKVVFNFAEASHHDEIDAKIVKGLLDLGIEIEVKSEQTPSFPLDFQTSLALTSLSLSGPPIPHLSVSLNLDVTTILTLISSLTYSVSSIPKDVLSSLPSLQYQSAREKIDPILPELLDLFKGRDLFTTATAIEKVIDILIGVGGPTECSRFLSIFYDYAPSPERTCLLLNTFASLSNDLNVLRSSSLRPSSLPYIQIIPSDVPEYLLPSVQLPKIEQYHVDIFGTALKRKACTVTANTWVKNIFQDYIKNNNLNDQIEVWTHEPRSLVEKKWRKWELDHIKMR